MNINLALEKVTQVKRVQERIDEKMIDAWLSVFIEIGINRKSNIKDHWSKSQGNEFVKKCISRDD